MKEFFEIVTLHDCAGCNDKRKNLLKEKTMLRDPVSVILAGVGILKGILGLFGGGRTRLTDADWQKLFPAQGYWTNKLKNYLAARIHYDVDLGNMQKFTNTFVYDNGTEICGYRFGQTQNESPQFSDCVTKFYALLQKESEGKVVNGTTQAGIFGDFGSLIPLLVIGGIVFSVMGKKSTPRRKRK